MEEVPKNWVVRERLDSDLMTHILRLRGIENRAEFLAPAYQGGLHDPYLMQGMAPAVDRLVRAIMADEVIGVFADYDTDGTPGAALLIDGLRALGAQVRVYIAMRQEGYGLSERGLLALIDAGARVVMTIDLGITGAGPAALAQARGVDVIITDHHVVQPELFPATAWAVVNPKQAGCRYPFKELCGGGIIWKVFGAVVDRLAADHPDRLFGQTPDALKKWGLDLAAIATICDMVPLVGENRVIAHYGLIVLRKTRRVGLQALAAAAGIDATQLTSGQVGFQIGPRLNAPTRLNAQQYRGLAVPGPQPSLALALLLTTDPVEADCLAVELTGYNHARQILLERVLAEAYAQIEAGAAEPLIFLAAAGWPPGIVGLVASRVVERYGRPAIILGIDGLDAIGSARSIDGLNLVAALAAAHPFLKKYGGHTKAAGLTVGIDQLSAARQAIGAYVAETVPPDRLRPTLTLDAELQPAEVTLAVADSLASLSPFGTGNPQPVFSLPNAHLTDWRPMGAAGQHARLGLQLAGSATRLAAVAFRQAEQFRHVGNRPIDLACQLTVNTWQNRRELQLQILDSRPACQG